MSKQIATAITGSGHRSVIGKPVDQSVYRLDPPYLGNEYIVVSSTTHPLSGWETFIFPGDAGGEITSWRQLEGSVNWLADHNMLVESLGYELEVRPWSDLDLDALEKVAREATPGEWRAVECGVWDDSEGVSVLYDEKLVSIDATHIAAFDPPTVLALIARVREAEAKVERVRAMHTPPPSPYGPDDWMPRRCPVCVEENTWGNGQQTYPCETLQTMGGEGDE